MAEDLNLNDISKYDWAAAMALPSSCNSTNCASQINVPHQGICPKDWHLPRDSEGTRFDDEYGEYWITTQSSDVIAFFFASGDGLTRQRHKYYLQPIRCVMDNHFACNMTATTGISGQNINPAPIVTCNGATVTGNITWQNNPPITGNFAVNAIANCDGGPRIAGCGPIGVPDEGDGRIYGAITINGQTWMASDLNLNGISEYDWATAMNLPSSCNSTNCASQINAPHQGICPKDWHMPSREEWPTQGQLEQAFQMDGVSSYWLAGAGYEGGMAPEGRAWSINEAGKTKLLPVRCLKN
jgi:hypothetical protein